MTTDPSTLQRIASDPSASVWVAASAGSGKTKVLTDRVLRLLLTGASPSRLLCITYTKAAAAEMQNRIHKRLAEWVTLDEAELIKHITELSGHPPAAATVLLARQLFARLLEDAPGLRIQTFHSFCQSLLARFPLEAGVPPHFTLIEERDAKDLLEEARLRLLESGLAGEDVRLSAAISEVIAESGEWGFTEVMREIIAQRRTLERVLAQEGGIIRHNTLLYEALGLPHYGVTEEEIAAEALPMDSLKRQRIAQAISALLTGGKTDTKKAQRLEDYLRSGDAECLLSALLNADGGLPKDNRQMTAKLQKAFPDSYAFLQLLAEECSFYRDRMNALGVARLSDAVMVLAEALFSLYAAMKRGRGYLDYDDLILKTRTLLQGEKVVPWVLYKLDGSIDHLLIDEAQDTSPEQWELKVALENEFFSGEGARQAGRTLFVVGDEKQSIYRFQGADPEGFGRQRDATEAKIAGTREHFSVVPMNISFRSSPLVLRTVDAVFAGDTARQGMGDTAVEHIPHRLEAPGRVELWPLERWQQAEEQESNWPIPDTQRETGSPQMRLAEKMAATIAGWIKHQRVLRGYSRPVRAGDILVLVRTRTDFMGYLSRALKERGVPVAGLDRMRIADHLAVRDLLACAQFLLLPGDDYTLACLLKSPLYNLSEKELFTLCHGRGDAPLWERVKGHAASAELEELLAQADRASPHALFADLLYARGGRVRFMARMGNEVEDVLDMFMGLALEYERLHTPNLQGFLSWMEHGTGDIKRDMGQESDAVRIMTIHGAKGLEAPIVFLPDTTGQSRLKDKLYFFSTEGREFMLCSQRSEDDDGHTETLRENRKQEDARESNRLLYVAMTRAQDELYIAGCQGKRDIPGECWYRLVREGVRRLEGVEEREDGTLWREEIGKEGIAKVGEIAPNASAPLPDYLRQPPLTEAPLPVFAAPSHLDEGLEQAGESPASQARGNVRRGTLIHRLLHLLSAVELPLRAEIASEYLKRYAPEMSQEEQETLKKEVLAVMVHAGFSEVFSPHALAEAPLAGEVEGKRYAGQVDRLVVKEDEVLVIDFKTGRLPENNAIPDHYTKQMQTYAALLAGIYPERKIRCALLFTAELTLLEVA